MMLIEDLNGLLPVSGGENLDPWEGKKSACQPGVGWIVVNEEKSTPSARGRPQGGGIIYLSPRVGWESEP